MLSDKDTKLVFFTEKKGVGDLTTKTIFELKELLERQNHILKTKSLINQLKDKGEKVRKARDEIAKELQLRNNSETVIIKNSSDCEWRDSKSNKKLNTAENIETDDKDVLRILATNKIINKTCISHNQRLIDKETDPNFIYRPSSSLVSQRIKKLLPETQTVIKPETSIKIIDLNESLDLLTEQISALKIYGKKRAEQVVNDRINESASYGEDLDEIEDNDETIDLLS